MSEVETGERERREHYLAEARAMFNDICILADTDIVRLVGFSEDDRDYYWVTMNMRGERSGCSMVGPCISLKGLYPRYDQLEWIFSHNGCPPQEQFYLPQPPKEEQS